jgi:hypothetical protein
MSLVMNKLEAQINAFWNSPLDEEEQWYESHSDEFKPVDKQSEMRKKLIEAANKPAVIHFSVPF